MCDRSEQDQMLGEDIEEKEMQLKQQRIQGGITYLLHKYPLLVSQASKCPRGSLAHLSRAQLRALTLRKEDLKGKPSIPGIKLLCSPKEEEKQDDFNLPTLRSCPSYEEEGPGRSYDLHRWV